jgi:hypothetical protein
MGLQGCGSPSKHAADRRQVEEERRVEEGTYRGDLLVVLLHNTITRFPHLVLVSFLLCVSHPSVLLIVGERT